MGTNGLTTRGFWHHPRPRRSPSVAFIDQTVQAAALKWGLLCTETSDAGGHAVGGNALDQALWESPASASLKSGLSGYSTLGVLPFDHERLMVSAVVSDQAGRLTLVTKGAPETVLARCSTSRRKRGLPCSRHSMRETGLSQSPAEP